MTAGRRPWSRRPGEAVKVGLVRVDQVLFHPHNVRRDLGDLRQLAESIASFGVMQPIAVERYGDKLRLRAGERRVAAAKIANVTRIPAVIYDEALDDENWLIHSVQENVMRRQLDDGERMRAVQALLDLGCSKAGVAETFGVSTTTVVKWLTPKTSRPARPAGELAPPRPGRAIPNTKLQTFASEWRTELLTRRVSADEVLDHLDNLIKEGRLTAALPDGAAAQTGQFGTKHRAAS